MKKNGTPNNGASKTESLEKRIIGALVSVVGKEVAIEVVARIVGVLTTAELARLKALLESAAAPVESTYERIAAALRVPNDNTASVLESDALRVAAFAAVAVKSARAMPTLQCTYAKVLSGMADLSQGAAKPGMTFNSDIAILVSVIDFLVTDDEGHDPSAGFILLAEGGGLAAKLLEGLDKAEARTLVGDTFALLATRKLRAPAGVVVNLLHAAAQRGVRFDGGANVSLKSTRTQIAHIVDGARGRGSL